MHHVSSHDVAIPFASRLRRLLLSLSLVTGACAVPGSEGALGELALGLTTEAGGITYRLSDARFTLEGPEAREFDANGEDELALELPAGAYRLTLLEGFQLTRVDDGSPVTARLVSQNPAPVVIRGGDRARVTLRFELAGGESVGLGAGGTLEVGIEVASPGSGGESAGACAAGLRINELDYEQASSDNGEFIELLQTGSCPAPLADLALELVNGNDGEVYARYALGDAAPSLAAGERLVLGDPDVLAALGADVKRAMLNASGLQNGPDGVRIVQGEQVIDAVAYAGEVAESSEGGFAPEDNEEQALSRCPDGFDTQDGAADFQLAAPSPGAANTCS